MTIRTLRLLSAFALPVATGFVSILGCAGGGGPGTAAVSSRQGGAAGPAGPPTLKAMGEAVVSHTVIADSIGADPTLEALVAPFRDRMGEEIRQVIGEASVLLAKSVPEGTLGNFAADAMLWAARRETAEPVHMALTNNGGLRVPIAPGPITVGQMFELMPFENMLSVLTLTGAQVQELADALARRRGEPIAGFTFRIETSGEDRVAGDILVGGAPLDLAAEYRLVTNDYLANGGDSMTPFRNPVAREDLPVLLRDAFIQYVREEGVIRAEIEGRITGGIGR